MLEYDRIDFSEGIDINKRGASKECDICHYCYFLDKNFKQEPYVFNGCHDLMQKAMNFNDFAIVFVKGSDQRILFWYMSNNDVINITKHSNLNEKSGSLQFFFYISKISGTTYYKRNRYVIWNRAKDYYKNDKQRLRDNAKDKCRNSSEEEKHK